MNEREVFKCPRWLVIALLLALQLGACNPVRYDLRPHGDYHSLYQLSARAESAYAGQQWNMAQQYYLELSRLTPADGLTWLRLGNTYAQQGDLNQSQKAFEAAIRLQPEALKPRYNLATVNLLQAQHNLRSILQGLPIEAAAAKRVAAKLRKIQALLDRSPAAGGS